MDDTERDQRIAEIRARREARGMADPLNRLTAHINAAIDRGEPVIVGETFPAPGRFVYIGGYRIEENMITNIADSIVKAAKRGDLEEWNHGVRSLCNQLRLGSSLNQS